MTIIEIIVSVIAVISIVVGFTYIGYVCGTRRAAEWVADMLYDNGYKDAVEFIAFYKFHKEELV